MKKHAYEAPVPPEAYTPRLPRELSAIILRMMAKLPGDRYKNLAEVIRTLEDWLGLADSKTARFTPREDQIAEIETLARQFRSARTAAIRQQAISAFLTGSALFALLLTIFGKTGWACGVVGLVVQATLCYFFLNGWSRKTDLFQKVRQFASGLSRGDWLVAAAGTGLFLAFLWLSNWFWLWIGFGLLGTAAALALWYGFDRTLDAERHATLQAADQLIRRFRRSGVPEFDAQFVVAKYAGRQWEEFFEALFGYEAKLRTRTQLLRGSVAGKREPFASWRDPLYQMLTSLIAARKNRHDRELLERSELSRMIAAGMPKHLARRRAAMVAAELVEHAELVREWAGDASVSSGRIPALPGGISVVQRGIDDPEPERLNQILTWFIGPPVRAVLAAFLIAACALWVWQNDLLRLNSVGGVIAAPLAIVGVPEAWTSWCDTANVGWGGVLLLASLFFQGHRMAALSILGAGIAVLGHKFGIRTVEPIRDYHVAMLVGTVFALVGYRLHRPG
jgi:hypothetical protein